jgi:hypothetical protein
MVEAAAKGGAKGIVSVGTGAGRPTPAEDAIFDKCFKATGMLMCLCNHVCLGTCGQKPRRAKTRLRRGRQLVAVESAVTAVIGAAEIK